MASFATKILQKCAKVRSHIARPKKGRTHAHRTHISKCFSHAHRTCASVRARVRVRILFRNSQFGYQPQVQPAYQTQVQPGYQPGVQPQLQAQAYPQTAPPPYTGQFYG